MSRTLAHRAAMMAAIVWMNVSLRAQEPASGPRSPAEEAKSFQLADPALVIELVACEPEVTSPVALAWDADERLYVAEMNDYPLGPESGSVRRLEDRDGDGRYETSRVFADNLRFPNSVLPFRDGVLVMAAPELIWLRDSDGDGRAEQREVMYTGFGEGNQQLRANGLTWGLDNWIYCANGRNDGEVRRAGQASEPALSLRASDFRFRPDFSRFEALPGQSQFGFARDDWGERFLSWNTIPIRHALFAATAVRQSPRLSARAIRDIADPADTGEVFPVAPRPQTFNRERTDYYNALSGLTILRGGALGEAYRGSSFVGESLSSLVHRRVLVPDGPTFVSQRGEERREFLAAGDPWFHPVYCTTGPDGALYIADFYRRWVEHPQYVADETQRRQVDWREGSAHGRIWRVRRRDSQPPPSPSPPLSAAAAEELAHALESDNGWRRDTAQRLLVERQDAAAIPALRTLCQQGISPLARVHALLALEGMSALTSEIAALCTQDRHPGVRRHAWRLLARVEEPEAFWTRLSVAMPRERDRTVLFEQALLLGAANRADKAPLLAEMARLSGADPWVCLALSAGIADCAPEFLVEFAGAHSGQGIAYAVAQLDLLKQAAAIATEREPALEKNRAWSLLTDSATTLAPDAERAVLVGLAQGLRGRGAALRELIDMPPPNLASQANRLASLLSTAREQALADAAAIDARLLAIQALALGGNSADAKSLLPLLSSAQPPQIQSAAAAAICDAADESLAAKLFDAWSGYSVALCQPLAAAALQSPTAADALLAAVVRGQIAAVEIDANTREALLHHPRESTRAAADRALAAARPESREQVLTEYRTALTLSGSARRGEELYKAHCAGCHVMRGLGHRVGPDLSGVGSRTKENLLMDILDPNQQIAPNYLSYTAIGSDGRVATGLVALETAESVTLRQAEGIESTLQRDKIESIEARGASFMPTGFEQRLSAQEIADLLAFLQSP